MAHCKCRTKACKHEHDLNRHDPSKGRCDRVQRDMYNLVYFKLDATSALDCWIRYCEAHAHVYAAPVYRLPIWCPYLFPTGPLPRMGTVASLSAKETASSHFPLKHQRPLSTNSVEQTLDVALDSRQSGPVSGLCCKMIGVSGGALQSYSRRVKNQSSPLPRTHLL